MTSDSMETNHAREGFAKKIAHKLQRKHDEDEPDTGKPLHDKPDQHPRHHKVEGYVESGVHGGLREVLDALSQPEVQQLLSRIVRMQAIVGVEAAVEEGLAALGSEKGMAVVGRLVASQATVFAKASIDPIGRQAAREGAKEIVIGSYDALEAKYKEWFKEKKLALQLGGLVCAAFLLPLILCMWRFALFGLGPGPAWGQCSH